MARVMMKRGEVDRLGITKLTLIIERNNFAMMERISLKTFLHKKKQNSRHHDRMDEIHACSDTATCTFVHVC